MSVGTWLKHSGTLYCFGLLPWHPCEKQPLAMATIYSWVNQQEYSNIYWERREPWKQNAESMTAC